MKKTFSFLIVLALLAVAAVSASAQSFDLFGSTRTLQLGTPFKMTTSGQATALATNTVDIRSFDGIGILNLVVVSNSADVATTPALIATIEDSADTTNYTALTTIAVATSTSIAITNSSLGVGTNIAVTDTFLLPGTFTTPTASSAGFATRYLSPAAFTSLGTQTNGSSSAVYQYGLNLNDVRRYLRIRYSFTGSNLNYSLGATLTGRTGTEVQ